MKSWVEKDAYYVYVLTDKNDDPVYVGQTGSLGNRLGQHARQSPFWRYVTDFHIYGPYTTRNDARDVEEVLIWDLGPLANKPTPGNFSFFGLDYVDCIDTFQTLSIRAHRSAA